MIVVAWVTSPKLVLMGSFVRYVIRLFVKDAFWSRNEDCLSRSTSARIANLMVLNEVDVDEL